MSPTAETTKAAVGFDAVSCAVEPKVLLTSKVLSLVFADTRTLLYTLGSATTSSCTPPTTLMPLLPLSRTTAPDSVADNTGTSTSRSISATATLVAVSGPTEPPVCNRHCTKALPLPVT